MFTNFLVCFEKSLCFIVPLPASWDSLLALKSLSEKSSTKCLLRMNAILKTLKVFSLRQLFPRVFGENLASRDSELDVRSDR